MRFVLVALVLVTGCLRPLAVERRELAVQQFASRVEAAAALPRLLRPRFGLPVIAQAGAPFSIERLEAPGSAPRAALVSSTLSDGDAAACARGAVAAPGCWPLATQAPALEEIGGERVVSATATTTSAPPPGGYDLVLAGDGGIERAHRAVWLRADDPAALAELRVAHLSDLHVGKRTAPEVRAHLDVVVDELNRLRPDLVVLTGDIVDNSDRAALVARAAATLQRIEAPLLVVPGNHDHGFGPDAWSSKRLSNGWVAFARAFHPFLFFETKLGRWRFLGFDSGASVFSPFILTRGLQDGTVQAVRAVLDAARDQGDAGVVLFSHAPSRARLTGHRPSHEGGPFGHMLYGAAGFERAILDAARAHQRVLHLSGHTHWSDVFESDATDRDFVRWDHRTLDAGPREITGRAALVNIQSATHSTFPGLDNGRGYGFALLTLRDGNPTFELHRLGE